jgi:hypothetical protein
MILDLIAIIFIVVLSFIFCYKDNNYKCQLSHIIIGISVIVFYKVAKFYQVGQYNTNKEGFISVDTTKLINDFINGNQNYTISQSQAAGMTNDQLTAYNAKLQELIDALQNINNPQATTPNPISANPSNINKLNLDSQQQYQMFVIDYLNNQLQNARDIVNAQTVASVSSNYKPIKVYSSCVISNADGTNTIQEIPINSSGTPTAGTSSGLSSTQQIIRSTSQSGIPSTGPALMQQQQQTGTTPLYPGAGVFSSLLSGLSGANIGLSNV